MAVQKQTEIRMRGTWNGGGGEGSLEIIGTGTQRHSLRGENRIAEEQNTRGGEQMQLNSFKTEMTILNYFLLIFE